LEEPLPADPEREYSYPTIPRREGRELALRVLYQADVGREPFSGILAATLDQACQPADEAAAQILKDTTTDVREAESVARKRALTSIGKRQITVVTRAIDDVLTRLAEDCKSHIRAAAREAPTIDADGALARVRASIEESITRLESIGLRPGPAARSAARLVEAAAEGVRKVEAAFEEQVWSVCDHTEFAVRLIRGTIENGPDIDRRIAEHASGWSSERQPAVDRNILRLAAYEMFYEVDASPRVVINEAVELAKKYSSAESSGFINGVLGALIPT